MSKFHIETQKLIKLEGAKNEFKLKILARQLLILSLKKNNELIFDFITFDKTYVRFSYLLFVIVNII